MASKLIVGNVLVHAEEYIEKKQLGFTKDLERAVIAQDNNISLEFSGGTALSKSILENSSALTEKQVPVPYEAIGIGKPLCVEILTVYTGDYPNGLFGGKKDLLLTTGVKSSITYDAASRAINRLEKKGSEKTFLQFTGTDAGTKMVYYSPAVDVFNTLVTLELIADNFDQEVFDQVSKLFEAAAGIPIFLPAATILLAGSHIVKAAGNLGNSVFASKAYLKQTQEIKFNNAGSFDTVARQVLLYNDRDETSLGNCEVKLNNKNELRLYEKQSGKVYEGEAPYFIINLDGRKRPDLESFSPKLASSSLLQKFYGADDLGGQIASTIEDAMQLYNDLGYKKKAERARETLLQITDKNSDEYKRQEALLNAYLGNIKSPEFKPQK